MAGWRVGWLRRSIVANAVTDTQAKQHELVNQAEPPTHAPEWTGYFLP